MDLAFEIWSGHQRRNLRLTWRVRLFTEFLYRYRSQRLRLPPFAQPKSFRFLGRRPSVFGGSVRLLLETLVAISPVGGKYWANRHQWLDDYLSKTIYAQMDYQPQISLVFDGKVAGSDWACLMTRNFFWELLALPTGTREEPSALAQVVRVASHSIPHHSPATFAFYLQFRP